MQKMQQRFAKTKVAKIKKKDITVKDRQTVFSQRAYLQRAPHYHFKKAPIFHADNFHQLGGKASFIFYV